MSEVLIIDGHPNPASLCTSLAQRYAHGLQSAGMMPSMIALRDLDFDPILHAGYHADQPLEPDLKRVRQAIAAARHVVLFTPVWWGSVPALLKGFLDRTLQPGWAFRYLRHGRVQGLLSGRSARLIITSDSPGFYLRWIQGNSAANALVRSTFKFCGFAPVSSTHLGPVHGAPPDRIAAWLTLAQQAGITDASKLQAGQR